MDQTIYCTAAAKIAQAWDVSLRAIIAAPGTAIVPLSGKFWNMSLRHALEAAGDSARYGHPVEHTAEVLVVNLLIFSTLVSVAGGAITGTLRHFWMTRHRAA